MNQEVVLKKIPTEVYQQMVDLFSQQYHFKNGERMRLANYYVGISRNLSDQFIQFIDEIKQGLQQQRYPKANTRDGFQPHPDNLLVTEQHSDCSFASFDMAVTENGLQSIEFQAVATYPVSAAKLNQCLLPHLNDKRAFIFADDPATTWEDFTQLYRAIIADDQQEGVIITDRLLDQQKTSFEFYATQQELGASIDIVDMKHIYEQDRALFYHHTSSEKPVKINRLYNRILLSEALFEDDYPHNNQMLKFRFDNAYESLKFINHPVKLFDIAKYLSPYIEHPFNPDCFELAAVADDFRTGVLKYSDYVWKHKWGAAGAALVLSPNEEILDKLAPQLSDYIAQKKVNFKVFRTDDGQDKIIELRFMTATKDDQNIIVPMARLGHITQSNEGITEFRVHFGDNNKEGYGFSPVVIFDR
jgi:hypothetical protein